MLGKYVIRRVLGQGGMGVVFAAFDPALRRDVAVKVPASSLVASKEAQERFVREARAIASVKHDHIVTVHAVETANGVPYMVMEYIDGKSLEQMIREQKKLPVADVIRIATEVSAALAGVQIVVMAKRPPPTPKASSIATSSPGISC